MMSCCGGFASGSLSHNAVLLLSKVLIREWLLWSTVPIWQVFLHPVRWCIISLQLKSTPKLLVGTWQTPLNDPHPFSERTWTLTSSRRYNCQALWWLQYPSVFTLPKTIADLDSFQLLRHSREVISLIALLTWSCCPFSFARVFLYHRNVREIVK